MKCKTLHSWNVTPKKAVEIQRKLAKKIVLKDIVKKLNYIAGVDVSYRNGKSLACISVLKYPELICIECKTASCKTKFPYIPGLLTFREGPAIVKCIKKITTKVDVFLFDGQGIAHPRRLGIATHTRPIYVSPGHKINLTKSMEITLKSLTRYRIPAPLRIAHHISKTSPI